MKSEKENRANAGGFPEWVVRESLSQEVTQISRDSSGELEAATRRSGEEHSRHKE